MTRPVNQEVNVTFYKQSGKYYTSGKATVNHYLFDREYKEDIVNTQNSMKDGWQGNYFVVVSVDDNVEGFHEALFRPEEFIGIEKTSTKKHSYDCQKCGNNVPSTLGGICSDCFGY